MAIDAVISGSFTANDRRTIGLAVAGNLPAKASPSIAFTDGVGVNGANILYQDSLNLSSGTLNVDLSGSLVDSYGTTITAARIKGIYIKNTGATTLTVGDGTNPFVTFLTGTGTLILPPGAWILAVTPDATGWVVTASTGDILKFAGTGAAGFDLAFLAGNA